MIDPQSADVLNSAIASVGPTDIVYCIWVCGGAVGSDKTCMCITPQFDHEGRALTVAEWNPLEVAEQLARIHEPMIDPERFEFGIVHGVPASNLIAFYERLSAWVSEWMAGARTECDYPDEFLDRVMAISLEPGAADPKPLRLPLTKPMYN
jgi:hypothetical protein